MGTAIAPKDFENRRLGSQGPPKPLKLRCDGLTVHSERN